jgi:type II secretory pathway pseudopilin PulG
MNEKEREWGFSIIELVVTIGILIVITTLIFASLPKFRQTVSLKRTAQEVALAIRQAQVYGLSIRGFQSATEEKFPAYGVYFNKNFPDSFILFADVDNDKTYDGSGEDVQVFIIQTGDKITALCSNKKKSPPGDCSYDTMNIIFFLTNPVTLRVDDSLLPSDSDAEVVIESSQGQGKTIVVLPSGQISVE